MQTDLQPLEQEAFVGAVSEIVTNAHEHGAGEVRLRLWLHSAGAVVTVSDEGSGPDLDGLGEGPLPRPPGDGGLGMWLAAQSCDELSFGTVATGFRVRIRSGPAPAA